MIESLLSLLGLAVIALAAWGVGRPAARWLGIDRDDAVELLAWELTLGLICSGCTWMALGLVGALYAPLVALLTVAAAFWGLVELSVEYLARQQRLVYLNRPLAPPRAAIETNVPPPDRRVLIGAGVLAGAIAAVALLAALAPPTAGDALYYHLELPKRWLTEHRLCFLPDHEKSTFPLLVEAWYVWALAVGTPATAALVHWFVGLLLAAATFALARPLVGERWGAIAAALTLAVPGVANQMTAPLNDLGLALFCTLALVAGRRVMAAENPWRWALAAGIMLGAALATKYLAILFIVALAAVTLWRMWGDSRSRELLLRGALLAAAAAAVVAAPWYARAAWHRGNPVYPFFAAHLGEAAVEALPDKKTPLGFDSRSLLTAPWQITMRPERFGGRGHQLGVLFLALAPGLFVARRLRGLIEVLAIAAVYGVLWYALRQNVRFLLPVIPIACTSLAWILAEGARWPAIPRRIVWCAVAACIALTPLSIVRASKARLAVAAGAQSWDEYLLAREPSYPAAALLNQYAGGRASVLSADYRGFYFDGRFTWEKVYRLRRGAPWSEATPAELSARLRADGFTHLLLAECTPAVGLFDMQLAEIVDEQLRAERKSQQATLVPLHDYVRHDSDGVARRYRLIELR